MLLAVLWAACALAQEAGAPSSASEPAYLLRMEHVRTGYGTCVLLRGDGLYHLEKHSREGVRVFQGSIDADDLRSIIRVVSEEALFKLTQAQISDPMLRSDDDRFLLSVNRPGTWQQLMFPDSASRLPYHASLDPLISWLDSLEKHRAQELSEEQGRSNCRPLTELRFSKRETPHNGGSAANAIPATNSGGSDLQKSGTLPSSAGSVQGSYILRMRDDRIEDWTIEAKCLLISSSGAYHWVKQVRRFGDQSKVVHNWILDGVLQSQQLATLHGIIDSEEWKNWPEEQPERKNQLTIMPSDSYTTHFSIPRAGGEQKIVVWKALRRTVNFQIFPEEHGKKLVVPFRQWLKENLNESAAIPVVAPTNARCDP